MSWSHSRVSSSVSSQSMNTCNNHLLAWVVSIVVPVYQLRSCFRGFVSRSSIKGAIESTKQHPCSNQLFLQQSLQFKFVVYITFYPTVWLVISVFSLVVGYRVKSDQATINNMIYTMPVRCEIVCIVYRYLQVLSCRRKVVSKAIKSTVLSDVKSSKSVCQQVKYPIVEISVSASQVSYRGVMYIYLSCTNVNISVQVQ